MQHACISARDARSRQLGTHTLGVRTHLTSCSDGCCSGWLQYSRIGQRGPSRMGTQEHEDEERRRKERAAEKLRALEQQIAQRAPADKPGVKAAWGTVSHEVRKRMWTERGCTAGVGGRGGREHAAPQCG
jgi:hypothetical protein